ncbi:MAG: site-2 protease family protein, partial [Candidatus Syntropharchaeia archaeon]
MEKLLLGFSVFLAYWIVVIFLEKKGYLKRHNITAIGPILMLRTERWQKLLEKLSKHRRFWRISAMLTLPFILVSMVGMFMLILMNLYVFLFQTPEPSKLTEVQNILFIPGINEFIPFTYGWIGIFLAVMVHEFSHALLCKVEGIKVKSMGLLLILIPIGGFTEPEERELEEAKKIKRMRMFAAGNMGNFFLAFLAFFLLINVVLGGITPITEGVIVHGGMEPGSVITSVNGKPVSSVFEFKEEIEKIKPGDVILIEYVIKKKSGIEKSKISMIKGDSKEKWISGVGILLYEPEGLEGLKLYGYEPKKMLQSLPSSFLENPIGTV